jgi:hypothetical protein
MQLQIWLAEFQLRITKEISLVSAQFCKIAYNPMYLRIFGPSIFVTGMGSICQ